MVPPAFTGMDPALLRGNGCLRLPYVQDRTLRENPFRLEDRGGYRGILPAHTNHQLSVLRTPVFPGLSLD